MNCDEVKDLLSFRPADVAAGEAASHVAGCGECRETVRALTLVRGALGEVPSGYPREAALASIRRAARVKASAELRSEHVVVAGARGAMARGKPTRGSFLQWLLGPAMRPALGFAAVGAVALAVVLATGTGGVERSRREETAGPPGRIASAGETSFAARTEQTAAAASAVAAAAPGTPPSPGGLSAAADEPSAKEGAKAVPPSAFAVVTPSTATKDAHEPARAKKQLLGVMRAARGDAVAMKSAAKPAGAAPGAPLPAEGKRAAVAALLSTDKSGKEMEGALSRGVAKERGARAGGAPTSRADRIGLREEVAKGEGTRESIEGQQVARAAETNIGGAGAESGGGGSNLGAALTPSGGGYDSAASMRRYGAKSIAFKSKAPEKKASEARPAAPSPMAKLQAREQTDSAISQQRASAYRDAVQKAGAPSSTAMRPKGDLDDAKSEVEARNYVGAQRIIVPRYGKVPREPHVALLLAETHIALKQWKDAAAVLESLLERLAEGPHVDRVLSLLEKVYEAQNAGEKLKAVRAKRASRAR